VGRTGGVAQVRLRKSSLRRCVFCGARGRARREQFRAFAARIEGADWEQREEWRSLAAELRNEHDGVVATFIEPANTSVADLRCAKAARACSACQRSA
jgi:hypothetical protein